MAAAPVPLIFSCDTEDYETPAADDAELLWARMFQRHGIRACFCVVGEEARALRDRGRRDVLAALSQHEIASHSNMHSAHPTPAEYLDALSWNDGVDRFIQEETPAVRDLVDLLGQQPSAWCKPGNSWGPVVPYAAGRLGIPLFCDAPFEWAPGKPMDYAGGLLLEYHASFDRYFATPHAERQMQMREDFLAMLASRREQAEQAEHSASTPGLIVMYTHPCRTFTAAFPSNFTAGRNPPREQWQPAPLRPAAERDALVRDFDAFLGWIAGLRATGQIVLTTYREVSVSHAQPASATLERRHLMELARALSTEASPIVARRIGAGSGGQWLSPAEQFGVLASALAHAAVWGQLPRDVPIRRLLGPLDPDVVPEAPQSERAPRTTVLRDVQQLAIAATQACARTGAVPAAMQSAPDLPSWGPARTMRLLARGLVCWVRGGAAHTIRVPSGSEEPDLAQREDFAALRFQNTWSIFPPGFQGRRLIEQARLQTWSAKPATMY